jgi:hypothetical protein
VLITLIGNLNSLFSVERYNVEPASRQANVLGASVGESDLAVIVIEEYFPVGVFSGGYTSGKGKRKPNSQDIEV